MIGRTLGPYQVVAKLGEGGMGEVYRATDTNLGRQVAIKVLSAAVAHDAERLARFDREARTLATLNHPHIAQIYGLEKADGMTALVMELVEGPTLDEVIARGRPEAERPSASPKPSESAAEQRGWGPAATQKSRQAAGPAPRGQPEGERASARLRDGEVRQARGGGAARTPEGERASASLRGSASAARRWGGAPRGLSIDDALAIARQIADALEAAHAQGIIHRDLKPANVKVRDDGTVKVLDFGLAKALEPVGTAASGSASMSPTITSPAMTEMGVILGTAAYMSPEQARGRAVDRRADIWAFGCVLLEMLTGKRAFEDEDISLTLSKILRVEPDFDALPRDTPPRVRHVLRACLQKDPRQRLHDMADVRLALDGAFESAIHAPAATEVAVTPSPWRRVAPVAAALVVGALAAGVTAGALWPRAEPQLLNRFDHDLPASLALAFRGRPVIALAPDGRAFVCNTTGGLYLRAMGELEGRLIPGTERGVTHPFFSPDGQSVGFWDPQTSSLRRIAISGGASAIIAAASNPFGATWGADGTILFGQADGIWRVAATGGTPERVIEPREPRERVYGPQLLPDEDLVLFSVTTSGGSRAWDEGQIVVQSLSTGERTVLVSGGSDGRYLPSGHLVYALGGGLYAVAVDLAARTVIGGGVPLVQGLARSVNGLTGAGNYGVSQDGTLVYVASDSLSQRTLTWVSRTGQEQPLGAEPHPYNYARISPDGTRVSISTQDELYAWDLAGGILTNVTASDAAEVYGVWTPDGRRLIYSSDRDGPRRRLYWTSADGAGSPEPLTEEGEREQYPTAVSPDGQWLLVRLGAVAHSDLRMVSLDSEHRVVDLLSTDANEINAELSPNGRWMAYQSDRSGQYEVYVSPFPDVGAGRVKVSAAGGIQPVWARSGRELFYLDTSSRRLTVVPVDTTQASFVFQPGAELFDVGGYPLFVGRGYDVAPDGQRFLFIRPDSAGATGDAPPPQVVIVEHFLDDVKRLVPTK